MTNRRKVLSHLAIGAAAVPAMAFGVSGQSAHDVVHSGGNRGCAGPGDGPYAEYFPNVVVRTHDGRQALFYRDLLRGKTVIINCMSVENEVHHPVTANLVNVQRLLGERLGRDVFMYSLTVDPERDTPQVLRAFAGKHGIQPGWLFLSPDTDDLDLLRGRLFADAGARHHGSAPARDCSMGLVRYGNEAVGLWGSVPARSEPESIVKRLAWVETRKASTAVGTFKRRGPMVAV